MSNIVKDIVDKTAETPLNIVNKTSSDVIELKFYKVTLIYIIYWLYNYINHFIYRCSYSQSTKNSFVFGNKFRTNMV